MRTQLLAVLLLCSCDAASQAVVNNGFLNTFTVYRAWWQTTYFATPVDPQTSSEALRTVPGTDYAWAVLARNWDGGTPSGTELFAVRSSTSLALEHRGDELDIELSQTTVFGICGVDGTLTDEDGAMAALIFPDELVGTYDQATCTYVPMTP